MTILYKCRWEPDLYQCDTPPELISYDPLHLLARELKCTDSALPYALVNWQEQDFYGCVRFRDFLETSGVLTSNTVQIEECVSTQDPVLSSFEAIAQTTHLTEDQKDQLSDIVDKFPGLFSKGKDDLGKVPPESKICHRITLKPGASPPTRLRSMSTYSERERESSLKKKY